MPSGTSGGGEATRSPVEDLDTHSRHHSPQPGIALTLSGRGYQAMVFHLGALCVSMKLVSCPSLIASQVCPVVQLPGMLGLTWSQLAFDAHDVAQHFAPPSSIRCGS